MRMSELLTKEEKAIERLRAFEPEDGYYLAYSAGQKARGAKTKPGL